MKYLVCLLMSLAFFVSNSQEKVAPIIKNYGAIYQVPDATVKPDATKTYNIVIDVYGGSDDKKSIDKSLNNVARMLNLHAVGGVAADQMNVVLALHAQSTYSLLADTVYKEKFGEANPNIGLIKELNEAGVKITVCGQSLRSRGFSKEELVKEAEVAISMLTTITHYQNLGYMLLKF